MSKTDSLQTCWAALFSSDEGRRFLVYEAWYNYNWPRRYDGEPCRPLVFSTRKLARSFCTKKTTCWKKRGDSLRFWRLTPVKVQYGATQIK